jgi:predicted RNA-binding Zn-ribbon protein involved in translation (DUF1610 family)
MGKNLRICLWDIETNMNIVGSFSLYPESINYENILHEWYIITGCWKILGEDKVYSSSVVDDPQRFKKDHTDDYHVVKTLRDMLEDVDILIHHNGDKFDLKKFNSRLIFHKLPPLPKILTIDTLKEVKKVAAFNSNRLDYLCLHLIGEGKKSTEKGLWLRVLAGNRAAVREMVAYCKVDVQRLEDLYNRLKPYMKTHPNLATPDTHNCPKCNSNRTIKRCIKMRASGLRYQQYQCKDCGGYFLDRQALNKPLSTV